MNNNNTDQIKLDKDYQGLLFGEVEPRELYFKEFLNEPPLMLAFPGDPVSHWNVNSTS